ncbi:MAG TPA: hypothetical protein VJ508_17445, partial [Saprospiraceae bacterium]|nr:hypothetical protein [Saprospiraceae bacterium]
MYNILVSDYASPMLSLFMANKSISIYYIFLISCGLFFQACRADRNASALSVTIRLPNEPESLHPIFSKSAFAAQIESLIL